MHLSVAKNASSLPRTLRIFMKYHINLYYPHTLMLYAHLCIEKHVRTQGEYARNWFLNIMLKNS